MYREQIGSYVTQKRAKLYVPKNGGLNDYVSGLLEEIGVRRDGHFDHASGGEGRLDVVPVRGEDVGRRVEDCHDRDEAAYGLTGDDLFDAYRSECPATRSTVLCTYDWFDSAAQFCRPALCLMNRTGCDPASAGGPISVAVNAKYADIATRYLADRSRESGVRYQIVQYAGDTENTVAEGTHDACIEIVYRGERSPDSALSRCGLRILDVLRFSDISLIGLAATDPWREEYRRILASADRPSESATARLLADDNLVCKKIGEETSEYLRALTLNEGLAEEFNDVVYGVMVGAASRGVQWDDVEADLKSRWT